MCNKMKDLNNFRNLPFARKQGNLVSLDKLQNQPERFTALYRSLKARYLEIFHLEDEELETLNASKDAELKDACLHCMTDQGNLRQSFLVVLRNQGSIPIGTVGIEIDDPDERRLSIGKLALLTRLDITPEFIEAVYLVWSYAFEELNCSSVTTRIKERDADAIEAALSFGMQPENIYRSMSVSRWGRMVVIFSLNKAKWPSVKTALQKSLENIETSSVTDCRKMLSEFLKPVCTVSDIRAQINKLVTAYRH